jgi:hypothetical protein
MTTLRTDMHDDFCEAEPVAEAGGYTTCSCSYRNARGLVGLHDAQVRAEALREAALSGLFGTTAQSTLLRLADSPNQEDGDPQ